MKNNYNKSLSLFLLAVLILPVYTFAQGVFIQSSGFLVANGNAYIVVKDAGFTNNGTFTKGTGTVSFTGSTATANSFISGSAATDFYNLTLNKTANGIQLNRNIGVSGTLLFTSGDSLFLNNYNIDLGSTGSISGETNSKRIAGRTGGYIQATQSLNAPSGVNPGNLGLKITSSADLGSTIIRRAHDQKWGVSVYRNFDVVPTTNTGLNATIEFYYFHAELAGIGEGNLGMFSSTDATHWTNLANDGLDQTLDIVTKNGLGQLNIFTLSNISSPLAISLLYLKAKLINQQTLLTWATATETDNDHFEIERSTDERNFIKLASVQGAGNSTSARNYEYTDKNPVYGINYYRLKQVNKDGGFTYSKQVFIKLSLYGDPYLSIYPNPAKDIVKVKLTSEKNEIYRMQLFDVKGNLINSKNVTANTGINEFEWDIRTLPAGIYTLKIISNSIKSLLFIKDRN